MKYMISSVLFFFFFFYTSTNICFLSFFYLLFPFFISFHLQFPFVVFLSRSELTPENVEIFHVQNLNLYRIKYDSVVFVFVMMIRFFSDWYVLWCSTDIGCDVMQTDLRNKLYYTEDTEKEGKKKKENKCLY